MAASADAMRSEGARLEMVDARAVPARSSPRCPPPYAHGGPWSPRDGYANPLRIADGFTAAFARAGVAVRLHAPGAR